MRLFRSLLLVVVLLALGFLAVLVLVFKTAPAHRGSETHFDTMIVLGTPATADGRPSLEMRQRVDEAVREYRAGAAPTIIMTGGAAHNRFVEAQVMADMATLEGVPRNAIVVEGQAQDTIQNIWYSRQIMQSHRWTSAEIISSPNHLPRTALILGHYKGTLAFDWRVHAARWPPEYGIAHKLERYLYESVGLVKLHLRGFPSSTVFLPR